APLARLRRRGDAGAVSDVLPRVKEPHLAGRRWYPAAPDELAALVGGLLAAAGPARPGVRAIIVPHAAYEYSGPIAAHGFAASAGDRRTRAVILAPSHFLPFRGAAVLALGGYRTPLGVVPIDADAVAALTRAPLVRANPAAFMREHAVEIQLPLLQAALPGCALVAVLVGSLEPGDAEALATAVRGFLAAPDTLVVVSSDFVHYGALARVVAGDTDGFRRYVDETGATICGRNPIEVLLRALPGGMRGEQL